MSLDDRKKFLEMLLARWNERPERPLGEVVTAMGYNGAGHSDIFFITDEEFKKGLEKGWIIL